MHDPTDGYAGVDWATDAHAVCVVDAHGSVRRRVRRRPHRRRAAAICADGPGLECAGSLSSDRTARSSTRCSRPSRGRRRAPAARSRHCANATAPAGNKYDRSDAYVLADCLRTDGHRWASLEPDPPETVTLRAHVRARKDLVNNRVAVANQLRAHLRVVFPGAVGLFSDIDSPISLRFLERFPSAAGPPGCRRSASRRGCAPTATAAAGPRRALHARLIDAPAGLAGDEGDARGAVTLAYVAVLRALRSRDRRARGPTRRAARRPPRRPHLPIACPARATVRAATLLAEIGDCRDRFPDAESLRCLAGVAPSTRPAAATAPSPSASAATRSCATPSATSPATAGAQTPGPPHRYRRPRAAGKTHPHAERILARTWTHIIWRCWQDRVPYDPARHGAHQRLLQETA